MEKRDQDPRTTRSDRMAQCDAATADVHLLFRNSKTLRIGQRLGREGLVDLEDVDVRHGEAVGAENLLDTQLRSPEKLLRDQFPLESRGEPDGIPPAVPTPGHGVELGSYCLLLPLVISPFGIQIIWPF